MPTNTDHRPITSVMPEWLNDHDARGILVTDAALTIVGWNRWLEAQSGRPAVEIIGQGLFDVFPHLRDSDLMANFHGALSGRASTVAPPEPPFLLPFPAPVANGGPKFMFQTARISPWRDGDEVVGTVTEIEDVTQEICRECELRESDDRFRAFMDSFPAAAFIKDAAGRFVYGNQKWADCFSRPLAELIGRTDSDLWPAEIADLCMQSDREAIASGSKVERIEAHETPAGRTWWQVFKFPFLRTEGQRMIGGIATDVTQRVTAEEALRESEERFRDLFENASDLIQSVLPDGRVRYTNRAWREALGYSEAESSSLNIFKIIHEDSREKCREIVQRLLAGEAVERIQTRFVTRIGRVIDVEGRVSCQFKNGEAVMIRGIFRDVTDNRRATDELRESEQRFRTLTAMAPVGVYQASVAGDCLYVNDRWCEMTGYTPAEAAGRGWMRVMHPDDVERVVQAKFKCMASGSHFSEEFRYVTKDGRTIWVWGIMEPLRNAAGQIVGFIGSSLDITTRRRAEEAMQRAKEAAEAANRAKGQFLANVSHEIRTPLHGILGMAELLQNAPLDADHREYVAAIKHSGNMLMRVINDVLDFARIESGKMVLEEAAFDPREVLCESARSVAPQAFGKGLELVTHFSPNVPTRLIGDAGRLRQVVVNLLGNAIKFTHAGEIAMTTDFKREASGHGMLDVRVSDTGIGIAPHKHESVFDAFTQADGSTTRKYGGTGLGLSISRQLVERMGGRIEVESGEGCGSTFHFTIRVRLGTAVASGPAPPIAPLQGLHALVVDANAASRRALRDPLTFWGMIVHEASDWEDARSAASRLWTSGGPISVALLGLDVTGKGGPPPDRLFAAAGNIPVVFVAPGSSANSRLTGANVFNITKPVRETDLKSVVLEALGNGPAPSAGDAPAPTAPDRRAQRVLVAEDNSVSRILLERLLQADGCTVAIAVDGRAAVSIWEREPIDLILMDVQMPEMDGLQATAEIRRIEKTTGAHTPIIAVTAHALPSDRQRCLDAGMDGYLCKPIARAALREILAQFDASDDSAVRRQGAAARTSTASADFRIVDEVVRGFEADWPKTLADLRRSATEADTAALARTIHSLRGALAVFQDANALASLDCLSATRGDRQATARGLDDLESAVGDMLRGLRDTNTTPKLF